MARIVDIFARLLADDAGFEADVVRKSQKAGDAAGAAMGTSIAGGISKGATAIGKTLGAIGQDLTKTGRSMTTNLTLPILAAGGAATHFALDFDTSLRQISGLTDVTAEELDGIREKILAMGPAVGKGPQELVEAFYFIASAGFKADEAMQVLETSAKAAAAGLGETQTIAQVLGGVINAYGKENITAATAADILTEAVSQGTAEASGLANVIGNVVPGAAALGVSFDQVTAAMAGMTLTGVGVEESATSLIQIFSSLQKPTSQAEEALRGMGLSSAELRRQLREEGLLATLRTLEERFRGNETAAAAVFGNIRALRGVTALLTLDSEQLNAVFAKVKDSTDRLSTAYAETEGPQRELDRAMSDLQVTAIQLGTDVLPLVVDVLGEVAAAARELGKWWSSLDADTKKQIVTWLAWLAIAGPALILIGKLATGIGALFKVVGFLAGAKGIPLLVTKVRLLTLAMVGLEALPLLLWAASEQFRGLGEDVRNWPGMPEEFQDKSLFSIWTEGLGDASGAVSDFAGVMNREGADAFDLLDAKGSDAFRRVTAAAQAMSIETQLVAAGLPPELAAQFAGGAGEVGAGAEVMVDPIAEALQKAKEDAAKKAKEIIDAIIGGLFEGKQDLIDAWAEILEIINHPYPDLVRRADIEGKLTATALFDGLHSNDSLAQAKTAEFMLGLISQYETLKPGALAAGELVNPALQAGIDRNLDALVTWIQQTALPGITNPFDLADELELMGYEGLAGYVRGVEQARLDKIATTVGLVRRDVKAGMLVDLYNEGYNAGTTWGLGFEASTGPVKEKVKIWGGKMKGLLAILSEPKDPESPLRGITKWGLNAGQTIAAGLLRSIPDMVRAASAFGSAMQPPTASQQPAFAGPLARRRSEDAPATPDRKDVETGLFEDLRNVLAEMVRTVAAMGQAVVPQLGKLSPAFGGMSVPSVGATGVFGGGAAGGGDTYITNNYLDIQGEKPVVSTAAEIAEQAARLGRFRG